MLAAVLLASLAGCATGPRHVRTEVTTFNAWATLPADRSYVFSRTLEWQNSLEVQSYEDLVRDELALQGFRLAADPAQASLVVTLRPSVIGTSVRVRDRWGDPFWGGPWGGYYGGYYGGFYGRGFGTIGWPGYYGGYGGFDGGSEAIDVYHRRLEVDIDARATPGRRYYEGRVENDSSNDSLPQVMPVLVRALFSDFPGNNGQTRRVDVPVERR